jgi:hypothetical protein
MGLSVLPTRYRINGVLSTDATVMQNMETLARAAQSWFTYDVTQGKWAVIINREGSAVASFDDSNITGPIAVSGTGLSDLYNRVRVEFPHVDLDDQVDFVEIAIPPEDRNANEPDNTLNISFDVINDPVMAELLGLIELKQSRVDRVIKFTTDYSYIGLRAGDLIDVTNTVLGFTNKVFRIISLEEADDEAISISITATEYDANVYDSSDLFRYERSNENGIVTKGAIDPPTTPIITAYEQSVRPGVDIETTVPSGIVEKIEFWYSTDNTNFILVGTESPSGGGTYEFADTVIFNYDKFDAAGNVYAKCRAVNSTTTSEYSATASLIGFTPVQITQGIDFDTLVFDEFGEIEPLDLTLPLLLGALDTFLGGNDNMFDVFGEQFDDLFDSAAGDLPGGLDLAFQKVILDSDVVQDAYTVLTTTAPMSFTITQSGNYLVSVFANFGGNTSPGPVQDASIELKLFTGGTPGSGTFVTGSFTGTSYSGVNVYDDLDAHVTVALTAGTYNIEVTYYTSEATFLAVQTSVTGPAKFGAIEGVYVEPA